MEQKESPLLLRPEAARKLLDIGRNTFYELIREGKIPHIRLGKSIRVPRQALLDFIDTQMGVKKAG
jgi:excisionase family DNA binding protein